MVPSAGELVLLIVIGVLLFGAGRLPAVARALGQGISEIKSGTAPRGPEERGKIAK
ncbi:MAG: twin-arginine translocase TatA/TatE family subunit [Candidatus Hydrogenedentes bacterium]|nr:twin-arginine translocase TatA/TatE family subunit [Candidatus Hydrogenedentota bacterium]